MMPGKLGSSRMFALAEHEPLIEHGRTWRKVSTCHFTARLGQSPGPGHRTPGLHGIGVAPQKRGFYVNGMIIPVYSQLAVRPVP